ncbi:MAG: hypothetical protein RBR21_10740 [Bacteroidales bacterium]|nr:hypothetical protein [Bacteroidales bacterium]
MEKIYTENDSFYFLSEEFDESVLEVLPDNIAPEKNLVDAIIAYDKALVCFSSSTAGILAFLLN